MTEVEKWTEERGGLLVMAPAIEIAQSADDVHETCSFARSNALLLGEKVRPSPEVWLSLYRNHRAVAAAVVGSFGTAMFPSVFEADDDEEPETEPDDSLTVAQLVEQGDSFRAEAEEWLRAHLEGGEPVSEAAREILSKPEVLFFFRVTVPCWITHGRPVCQLLRPALRGNEDALLELLNLDPWVQEFPRVRQLCYRLQRERPEKFSKAMQGKLQSALKRGKVKVLLAGLISRVYGELDDRVTTVLEQFPGVSVASFRLEEPDIRALFDAVARDKGLEMDVDLPESPETFYKAIYRARDFWGASLPLFF